MLISLPKETQLISGSKNTSFVVFLSIWQDMSQFIFAKVMDKIIALCYLFIYFLLYVI